MKIKPETLAVIGAVIAAYGLPNDSFRITGITKGDRRWKRAGRKENMQARRIEKD